MEKFSDERFRKLSGDYEAEQRGLTKRSVVLKATLDRAKKQNLNIDRFFPGSRDTWKSQNWMAKLSASSLIKSLFTGRRKSTVFVPSTLISFTIAS